jgi:hypothetical protein
MVPHGAEWEIGGFYLYIGRSGMFEKNRKGVEGEKNVEIEGWRRYLFNPYFLASRDFYTASTIEYHTIQARPVQIQ